MGLGASRTGHRGRALGSIRWTGNQGAPPQCSAGLADSASPIVGVEIAEWEGPGSEQAQDLLDALAPLL